MIDTKPSSTISTFLGDSIIGMAAKELSEFHQFPMQTAMLSALTIASHAVGSAYSVGVPNRQSMPIPLFAISEQPSNSAKTGLVEDLYSGYVDKAAELNIEITKEISAHKKSIAEKMKSGSDIGLEREQEMLSELSLIPIGISDATPEGLERSIVDTNGFFITYSTEQGLSKTLLGGMYSEGNKKDDLLLKGFNGEAHSVSRANADRVTFTGRPYGGVFELSQQGTIERIMKSAGSTGIAERFLILSENDMLGKRTYIKASEDEIDKMLSGEGKISKAILSSSKPMPRNAFNQFRAQMSKFPYVRKSLRDKSLRGLNRLEINGSAHVLLLAAKQKIEYWIDAQQYRNEYLASMMGKIDLQMMKVAATLHCMNWDIDTHGPIGKEISEETVRQAFFIVFELFRGVKNIANGQNLYGDEAEDAFVYDYLSSQKQRLTMDKICQNLVRRKENPFRFYKKRGEAREKIKESVQRLASDGKIAVMQGKYPTYSA
jgi:hypothetical protein